MQATDFEYDGTVLSDYGYVICSFDGNGGVKTESNGAKIKFNMVSHHNGNRFSLSSSKYEECVAIELDICKDPDKSDNLLITLEEIRKMMKWLNRRGFHKLRFFDNCNIEEYGCHYYASFNVDRITVDGEVYGLRLTANTNSPFAYGNDYCVREHITAGDYIVARNISDEIGRISPDMVIVCHENGNLQLRNSRTGLTTMIKNCKSGEEIHIDGTMQIITSSMNSHDIANDFNYIFLSLENSRADDQNDIYVSLECDIEIRYSPIIKFVP